MKSQEERLAQIAQVENYAAEKNVSTSEAARALGITPVQFFNLRNYVKSGAKKKVKATRGKTQKPSTVKKEVTTKAKSSFEFIGSFAKKYPQITASDIGELFKRLH